MIKATKGAPKLREWFRPDQRPTPSTDIPETSVVVLLYDKDFDMHGLGWFNFDMEEWHVLEEFYLDNKWTWTYLPKPI